MDVILSVLFFIIISFWLMGLVGRLWLRYWVAKKQRQMEQQMRDGGYSEAGGGNFGSFGGGNFRGFYTNFGGGRGTQHDKQQKQEGEVTVENTQPKKGVNDKIGEYVDFEEVK